ncbi:MAG TPA: chemotaxis protein CheW [Cellvibrio sp.]|nr:chemotaxis protein CheW [Cellvibrio sp.]
MEDVSRIGQNSQREVASLLIPLSGQSMLLPNVTVAEIIPRAEIQSVQDAPLWYLGNCQWRELIVPVLSLEALNGEPPQPLNPRSRFAVLNTTGVDEHLPFIAILTQGLPRLARVSEDEISEREEAKRMPYDLMQVSWAGEQAVIPNIPAIERTFLEYLHNND